MDVYPLEEDTEDTAEAAPSKGICGLGKEFMRDDISSDEANEEVRTVSSEKHSLDALAGIQGIRSKQSRVRLVLHATYWSNG